MVDPRKVCLFIPPGLKKFKLDLFERIGTKVGRTVRHDYAELAALPDDVIPIVGASPELRPIIQGWQSSGRQWCYWDRGYFLRIFATWLKRGENGGFYRWHLNAFQMQSIRVVPDDRWKAAQRAGIELRPWRKDGRHIVIAEPTPTYALSHGIVGWTERTIDALSCLTDRKIVRRDKESKRPLQADLDGAHCLVAHGSNAAVEAVILGCPVIVDQSSAAALAGLTDLSKIEAPIYPDREPWVKSLAYSQFDERELVDGTVWKLLS